MRLAITVLSLLALLAAPAASATGCLGCCAEAKDSGEAQGREVCPCCAEREDSVPKCEPVCLCEHHAPQQAPQRTGEVASLQPASAACAFADHHGAPSVSPTTAGVNRTPPDVFTPLRI